MADIIVSEQQIAFYQEHGYIQFLNVLSAGELVRLRRDLEEALIDRAKSGIEIAGQNPEYDKVFYQRVNLWLDHAGLRAYTFHPTLARIACQLTRSKAIRLFHDHALIKRPGDSIPSPWHQDFPYWPMHQPGALSCWMALDDVNEANGCLQFIPRSHHWGKLPPVDLVSPQALREVVPDPQTKDFTPVAMPMPAGSCTFHDGLTFHYAGPNTSDKPRRAIATIYHPDGTLYTGVGHPVTDGLGLKADKPIAGERFPILYPAGATSV